MTWKRVRARGCSLALRLFVSIALAVGSLQVVPPSTAWSCGTAVEAARHTDQHRSDLRVRSLVVDLDDEDEGVGHVDVGLLADPPAWRPIAGTRILVEFPAGFRPVRRLRAPATGRAPPVPVS